MWEFIYSCIYFPSAAFMGATSFFSASTSPRLRSMYFVAEFSEGLPEPPAKFEE